MLGGGGRGPTPAVGAVTVHPVRPLLERAVAATPCEAILLSGGLDTSIVATLAVRHGLRLAVTVVVGDDPPDLPYATSLAQRLDLEHVVLHRRVDELVAALPELIALLNTFDGMYLRNDVVILEGLKEVARRGFTSCWTGDAADELLAGYSFMFTRPPEDIVATVRRFAASMHFNGPLIGGRLGVAVRSPYLDPAVVAYALTLGGSDLVVEHDGPGGRRGFDWRSGSPRRTLIQTARTGRLPCFAHRLNDLRALGPWFESAPGERCTRARATRT
jgi:asparagine synthase (glutamine-hydrolysing)